MPGWLATSVPIMIEDPTTAVILAGGDAVHLDLIDDVPDGAYVIAADSGLDQAHRLDLMVDLIVGDLDSVSAKALAEAEGIPIEQYPTDKNFTDLELALDAAVRLDADRIIVLGGHGGRLDHFLGNAAVLTAPGLRNRRVEWLAGYAHVYVVNRWTQLHGSVGATVSLLAVGGPATGVKTQGLRWPLAGDTLEPWQARGLSNQFSSPIATVNLESGILLAVIPGSS